MTEPNLLFPAAFYDRPTLQVARDLLGHTLVRVLPDGTRLSGRILETEAYTPDDPACHAHRGPSERARSMFGPPGHTYVYLIYGIYHCLNVVTQPVGEGAAVLIRAVEPLEGLAAMAEGRNIAPTAVRDLARGPGRLCQAFQLDRRFDGLPVTTTRSPIWIEHGTPVADAEVLTTPRIGITVTPEAIAAPWRLIVRDHPLVSGTRRQNCGQPYV